MHYVNSVRDLENALGVSRYRSKLQSKRTKFRLNLPQPILEHDKQLGFNNGDSRPPTPPNPPRPTQQFNVTLEL